MKINVCGKTIDTDTIIDVQIKPQEVFIETTLDFYRIKYHTKEDIRELTNWKHFSELTKSELIQAIEKLIITCEFFINTKEQCAICPLHKHNGCVFTSIPNDWR